MASSPRLPSQFSNCTVRFAQCPDVPIDTSFPLPHVAVKSHKVAYRDWTPTVPSATGRPHLPLVCVHGLTRNGSDFDHLAHHLSTVHGMRVVALDMPGRGNSDILLDTPEGYTYNTYVADVRHIIERVLGLTEINYLGTSMGGLISFNMLSRPTQFKVKAWILNDIGAFVPVSALEEIAQRISTVAQFESTDQLGAYCREKYSGFGIRTEDMWQFYIRNSTWEISKLPEALQSEFSPTSKYTLAFDFRINATFPAGKLRDFDLSALFDRCPAEKLLIIRGALSTLLTPDVVAQMIDPARSTKITGRRAAVEIPDCGHAPALLTEAEWNAVSAFLLADD